MNRPPVPAGAGLMPRLAKLDVPFVFVNSGTDFPPIIEGMAAARAAGEPMPQAVVCPHEHAALGMAHGAWLATGKAQAVMLHTNVGLANGAAGAINAAIDRAPLMMMSGRTPVMEANRFGARTVPIGWGQEMFDQTSLVREACKYDYELRFPEQLGPLLDRAAAMACSTPQGPVYLSLPREVLCEPAGEVVDTPAPSPVRTAPRPEDLAAAAEMIAQAQRPLVISQRGAGSAEGFAAMTRMAEAWGMPVCTWWAVALAIPNHHPLCVGPEPSPWLGEADLVLVVDALAPWMPDAHPIAADAKVIQLGPDPLESRTPMRTFRADLSLPGETAGTLVALEAALKPHQRGSAATRTVRRRKIEAKAAKIRAAAIKAAEAGEGAGESAPMSKAWVSKCLSDAVAGRDAVVLSELGAPLAPLDLERHDSWRQEPHAGGLGWSFPCALGFKLAQPERLVVATMGDGSYLFANPAVCHQLAEALSLPVLVLVLNNAEWGAVRHSVLGMYPDGAAAKANEMPLTGLSPTPDFTKIAEASRAWAEKVETGDALPAALARALEQVEAGRTALLEVRIAA